MTNHLGRKCDIRRASPATGIAARISAAALGALCGRELADDRCPTPRLVDQPLPFYVTKSTMMRYTNSTNCQKQHVHIVIAHVCMYVRAYVRGVIFITTLLCKKAIDLLRQISCGSNVRYSRFIYSDGLPN